jgi:quaternary ammonium compound-resistance protein SugE
MNMAWMLLILAGITEIGWPIGLKISRYPDRSFFGIAIAIIFALLSGWLLWSAQKDISIGTSYAVWTGIGTVGTFLVGILFFDDVMNLTRLLAIGLVVAGTILLKYG